jgi:rRNA maturation RNase YbeY
LKVRIFYDNVKFRLKGSVRKRKFIEKVIREDNKMPADLSFIFTSDERIREINKEFLGHDYFTDVISFNSDMKNVVNGEVYISIDSVRKNSKVYTVPLEEEVIRVMIHGTLHLLGYTDEEEKQKVRMFELQEKMIKEFEREVYGFQV